MLKETLRPHSKNRPPMSAVDRYCRKTILLTQRARLIRDQVPTRNVDPKIHTSGFDCCVLSFYSFSAATFSTASVNLDRFAMSAQCRLMLRLRTYYCAAANGSKRAKSGPMA